MVNEYVAEAIVIPATPVDVKFAAVCVNKTSGEVCGYTARRSSANQFYINDSQVAAFPWDGYSATVTLEKVFVAE